jgi:hypothetical protein
MARFLIEVPHENSKEACNRAVRIFMETGFHFMTNADWGCSDDVHKAWFFVEVDSKEDARVTAVLASAGSEDYRCGKIPDRGCRGDKEPARGLVIE